MCSTLALLLRLFFFTLVFVDGSILDDGPVSASELLFSSEVYWPTCGHFECMALILCMLIAAHWLSGVAVAVHRHSGPAKGTCMCVSKRMLLGGTGLGYCSRG